MKKSALSFVLLAPLLFAGCALNSLHRINTKSSTEIQDFFRYRADDDPIISGHRGGMIPGFPENSIETFENTLKHTPAFFEIDPRLTKDSVIVLMHDATLERTTNGQGNLSDYTWAEVQDLYLKDPEGNRTESKVPTLAEAIEWARGKTILNLDRKDVPPAMIADLLDARQAWSFVMLTVHKPEQAQFYLERNPNAMFSAHIRSIEAFHAYKAAGIPWKQMMAYIGPHITPENQQLYALLHEQGVKCMISSASSYDKLDSPGERAQAYRAIIADGADVLESDLPIEVSEALRTP